MNINKMTKANLMQEVTELRQRVEKLEKLDKERKRSNDALMEAIGSVEDEIAQTETIIAAMGDGISIQDRKFKILYQNRVHRELVGDLLGEQCSKAYQNGAEAGAEGCPVKRAFKDGGIHRVEHGITDQKGVRHIEVTASCLKDSSGKIVAGIEIVRDITSRKRAEEERERLIDELQRALAQIKTLSGLLPICASCKNIRDDRGYWKKIEQYIQEHSSAVFTHGLCPDCAKKLYPDIYNDEEE